MASRSTQVRLLALTVAAVTATVLSGCSSSASETSPSSTGGTGSQAPVTLTVLDSQYFPDQPGDGVYASTGKALQAVDAAFMAANPNIKIVHTPVSQDNIQAKVRAAIASQSGPDIIQVYGGTQGQGYANGLVPLQDKLSDEQKKDLLFLKSSVSPDGNLYSIPLTTYGYFLFYNKALFKKAGLDPENFPKTWDEFLAAFDKLNAAGVVPISAGWKDGYYAEHWMFPFVTKLLNDDEFAKWVTLDLPFTGDSRFVQAANLFKQMEERKGFTPYAQARDIPLYDDVHNNFGAGKAAIVSWYKVDPTWEKTLGKGNIGVAAYPVLPRQDTQDQIIDSGANFNWGMTKWSPNQDAAWKYLSFITNKESQETIWKVSGTFPNNITSQVTSDDPIVQTQLKLLANPGNRTSYTGYTPEQEAVIVKYGSQVLTGQHSVDDWASQLDKLRLEAKAKIGG